MSSVFISINKTMASNSTFEKLEADGSLEADVSPEAVGSPEEPNVSKEASASKEPVASGSSRKPEIPSPSRWVPSRPYRRRQKRSIFSVPYAIMPRPRRSLPWGPY